MNATVKENWVAALESGEYKQGKARLKVAGENPTHCCLGVLCELYAKEKNLVVDPSLEDLSRDTAGTYPSGSVLDWAGLVEMDPAVTVPYDDYKDDKELNWKKPNEEGNGHLKLSVLNDAGFTFEQIAKLIKEQL